jgi:hypothetical protein
MVKVGKSGWTRWPWIRRVRATGTVWNARLYRFGARRLGANAVIESAHALGIGTGFPRVVSFGICASPWVSFGRRRTIAESPVSHRPGDKRTAAVAPGSDPPGSEAGLTSGAGLQPIRSIAAASVPTRNRILHWLVWPTPGRFNVVDQTHTGVMDQRVVTVREHDLAGADTVGFFAAHDLRDGIV